jgi:succinyl-CoA synthetase alpha subunit
MTLRGQIRKGEYFDSVTLMMASKKLSEFPGVVDSAIIMATSENKAILKASDLYINDFDGAGDMDLLLAAKAESEKVASDALLKAAEILTSIRKLKDSRGIYNPKGIEGALKKLPEANLVLISVAGKYAADEAMKALRNGLHVMLFSDNMPLESEIELKKYAVEKGLLVMGPDCGTAIINGVPLAFANAVSAGDIGIVAASGTGLQEVSCLISNAGRGISQAIGTGSRDISREVGGLMFIEGMKLLAADSKTKVILLISKPPYREVLQKIIESAKKIDKPIIAVFLGADKSQIQGTNITGAATLEEAAMLAVACLSGQTIEKIDSLKGQNDQKLINIAKDESKRLAKTQKFIRGLYSGGTFSSEAQLVLGNSINDIYSNSPTGKSLKLRDPLKSEKNTIIDMGDDEFTVGRLHPMIDFSLRVKRIISESEDPETAVILLDIVLGYGANPDPLADIAPAICQARSIAEQHGRYLPVVYSVTGTEADPQVRSRVVRGLEETGAIVTGSNAGAARLAGLIARRSEI